MKTMMIVRSDDDGGSGNFIDLSDIVGDYINGIRTKSTTKGQ